jgi:hypothetical protein
VPVTVRIRGIEYFDLVVAVDPRRDGTGSHSALLPPQARVTEDLGSFPAKRLSGASFFESCPTGQPAKALKTTRYRGISRIRLGLRVRIWATEASIWPLVSEATFWCLVFAEPITSMMSGARYGNRRPGRVDARHAANRCRARGCVGGHAHWACRAIRDKPEKRRRVGNHYR